MYNNAQWVDKYGEHYLIKVEQNGNLLFVPIDPDNADYQNIMQLVAQGKLVIAPADA